MKKFKLIALCLLLVCMATVLLGCAKGDYVGGYYTPGGDYYTPSTPGADVGEALGGAESGETGNGTHQPDYVSGLITASAWNDNDNYEMWKGLFGRGQTYYESGKFVQFLNNNWRFNSLNRVSVLVTDNQTPVMGASVVCMNEQGDVLFKAKTDATGKAYLFPNAESGKIHVAVGGESGEGYFSADNRDLEIEVNSKGFERHNKIELMFVVDVTGSMSDELNFLVNELRDVITRVAADNANCEVNLAFLFYRDNGDEQKDGKFDYYDFLDVTDEQNLSTMHENVKRQNASGGGDYPEAVDEALAMAVGKNWTQSNSTKILFHVLDAPAHEGAEYEQRYSSAVIKAAELGIRICPVLASSADTVCEYLVRQSAIYTGGTFVYITDHSGIGNGHLDPNLPNVTVERLNDLMVRLINGYHTGRFAAPTPWNRYN